MELSCLASVYAETLNLKLRLCFFKALSAKGPYDRLVFSQLLIRTFYASRNRLLAYDCISEKLDF